MLPALKYTVRHYRRNYSVISEKSECGRLHFYAMIELLYGANRFMVSVRKRNGNFSMTPTVHSCLVEPSSLSQNERGVANAQLGPYSYHCIIITAVCIVWVQLK